jgi:hypothetical protein
MKFNELKPGQYFKFKNTKNTDIDGHKFLLLRHEQYLNLVTLTTGSFAFVNDDDEVELVDNKTSVYHACRQAFVCGQERVPWHFTVHALREGLNMKEFQTFILTEDQYKEYPQLRELVKWLKLSLSASSVDNTKSQ